VIGLIACDIAPAERYDLALVDLDGVAYRGQASVAGAVAGLNGARLRGMRLVFVTNNASREPESVAAQLSGLGIRTEPAEVVTAAQAAASVLATRLAPGAKVLVVGGAGLVTAVQAAGFVVVTSADDEPDAVAQGFAPELGWTQLAEAAYAVQRGAWHVASNLDLSLPTERGFAPGNGSLVGAVRCVTGVVPDSAGKPAPTMFQLAVKRAGASQPLVIGDRLDTDFAGARAARYPGLLVLTGVSSGRDAVLARPSERPDLLGADLGALLVPHPRPEPAADGWWATRGAAARVVGGRLELGGIAHDDEGRVDLLRSACAASWEAVDGGQDLATDSVPEFPMHET